MEEECDKLIELVKIRKVAAHSLIDEELGDSICLLQKQQCRAEEIFSQAQICDREVHWLFESGREAELFMQAPVSVMRLLFDECIIY